MYSRQIRKARLLFALFDLLLTWLAFEAAYATRTNLQEVVHLERVFYLDSSTKYLLLLFAMLAWVLSALWLRAYDPIVGGRPAAVLQSAFLQSFWAGLAMVVFQFALRYDLSRPFLAIFVVYAFLFQALFRLLARLLAPGLMREFAAKRQLLIVGTGDHAQRVGRLVEESSDFGLSLLGFLDSEAGRLTLSRSYNVQPLAELPALLERHVIDEILFAVDSARLSTLEDVFLLCDEEGIRTRVDVAFFPHVNSQVSLDRLGESPLLTFAAAPHDEIRLIFKRIIDFTVALIALLIAAPLMALIALLIRATSPGPVIFRQERCGLNGRRFTLYKFRTMVADAEARKAALAHMNVKKTAFKIPNDPRLTPIGGWLRKFSLDELPQLWNIVKGEMAIVGPRPAVPSEVAEYERWQRRRLRMRPGLTCLWTLAGRDALDFDEWMKLDLAYIDTWSLKLDWSIMLRTVPHVLTGKGAN